MPSWSLVRRLRGQLLSDRFERRMAAELQLHIDLETDLLVARGMDPASAALEARRRFGSVAAARDACRDSWGVRALDEIAQDVRYAVRVLARAPGYTAAVLLTLALGIGANTAIFGVVHAVLLRALPYAHGASVIELRQAAPRVGVANIGFSAPELSDYRRGAWSLDAVVEYHQMSFNLLDAQHVSRVVTGVVSADFFDVIGVKPMLGRTFRSSDDAADAAPVLVLSYDYWHGALGADPAVVGRAFEMNDRVHVVVGVLPPVPAYPEPNDVYMPVSACPFRSAPHMAHDRSMRMVAAIGRMKPGVTLDRARDDLARVAKQLVSSYPAVYGPIADFTTTAIPARERLIAKARPTLLMLSATTGFMLLLVCANVANLTLARIAGRARELSLRTAIGAGRGRLARQLIAENLVLAIGGGALGLALAALARDLLVAFTARFTLRAAEVGIDRAVLLFALALSIGTGLLVGIVPAVSRRVEPRRPALRGALIATQVAISFVLLMAAGLMVRSLIKLHAVDGGFAADHVLTARVDLDWVKYDSSEKRRAFFRSFLDALEAQPEVEQAAWSLTFPLSPAATSGRFTTEVLVHDPAAGRTSRRIADLRLASPRYFQAIGMTLLHGRSFTNADVAGAPPVAIVNLSMARHQLDSVDPTSAVGRHVSLDDGETWATIVGVVNDVKQYGLDTTPSDEIYVPFDQRGPLSATLVVRGAGDPSAMLSALERASRRVDPRQPISRALTLEQVRRGSLDSPRVTTLLVALFAAVALVVTAAGIAGVVAFAVQQRSTEIGVRMALGASCASVVNLIVRQGMRPVLVGLACGVAAAAALARPLARLLYSVRPTDAPTYAVVAATLAIVATLACLAPARRAAAIDPMRALRSE